MCIRDRGYPAEIPKRPFLQGDRRDHAAQRDQRRLSSSHRAEKTARAARSTAAGDAAHSHPPGLMNPDDPKLTAYALDELDAAERAEIEQVLREHPEAAAEVEATRTFAADLRVRLQRERAEPLHTEQRAEVLA